MNGINMKSTAARRLALGLFAAVIVGSTPARANLLVNGDFEDPGLWGAWTFDASGAGGGTGPASGGFGIRDASGAGHGTAANGSYVGGLEWLPGTVSLSQTVSGLIVGAQYRLSFDVNLRDPEVPVTDSFRVMVDGITVFLGGDPFQYDPAYVHESILFTATSATTTITTLLGQVDSDTSYNIDNVELAAVPEPAAIALFGLGLAGLGFSRSKKSGQA